MHRPRLPVVRVVEQPHDLAAISPLLRIAGEEAKDTHSHETHWKVGELP